MSMTAASGLPLETLVTQIKKRVDLGDRDRKRSEDHYMAAGLDLLEAQARVRAELPGTPWLTWTAVNFPTIKESRIRQLMQIGRGDTTQAQLNAASNAHRWAAAAPHQGWPADEALRRYNEDRARAAYARKNASESDASAAARERDAERQRRNRAERDALRVANGGKPSKPRKPKPAPVEVEGDIRERLAETGKSIAELQAVYRKLVDKLPKPEPAPPGYYRPISNDEVRDMYATASPDVRAWLDAWSEMPDQDKDASYALFLNLTAIGELPWKRPRKPRKAA
jgi:hypothetical protein